MRTLRARGCFCASVMRECADEWIEAWTLGGFSDNYVSMFINARHIVTQAHLGKVTVYVKTLGSMGPNSQHFYAHRTWA